MDFSLEEHFRTLKEAVATHIPGRPHISTLHRWRTRGIGGVKLITKKIGGRRFVAVSELDRFLAAVEAAAEEEPVPARTAKRREAEIDAAERVLDRLGIGGGSGRRPKRTANESQR